MTIARKKFSSQADPALLDAARAAAAAEGRQFQSLLEDALSQYLERTQSQRPRAHVLEAFGMSLHEFDALYQELAQ
jgi:hypothetical protein